jgi:DNA repair protein RecN (Recombination protein N)
MLRHLSIKDFVIVDQIELEFLPGFTVLTGETGAGKSILIDALSMALGERGDISQIRQGCERAEICVTFDCSALTDLNDWLNEHDLQGDPDICLMRRIIDAGGRSRAFINGHIVTLQQLRAASEHLVAIHSQHAHQSLLQKEAQRDLLDAFAGCLELAQSVKTAFQNWQEIHQQRMQWAQRMAESLEKREQLEWQAQELSDLNFTAGEWQTLQTDHSRLSHIAALVEAAEMGVDRLSESETAIISQMSAVHSQLQNLLDYDDRLKTTTDLLESAQIQLQESIYELKHYRQQLDLDPHYLQEVEQRLSAIHAAARKYHVTPEALPDLQESVKQQLEALNAGGDDSKMQAQENAAKAQYHKLVKKLSTARQKAGKSLAQQVTAAMQTIAMVGGEFSVALIALEQGNATGLEQIEFQVSAHKGLPLRSLAKVASGGELSRISLAIQVITSKVGSVPTLIFDEVDVGIGGRVAEIVGQLLKQLGRERQVLCITHLPQVAATGDQQWQVTKATDKNGSKQVLSQIAVLTEKNRVEEIARMLGGVKITEATRKHAAEMLQGNASGKW